MTTATLGIRATRVRDRPRFLRGGLRAACAAIRRRVQHDAPVVPRGRGAPAQLDQRPAAAGQPRGDGASPGRGGGARWRHRRRGVLRGDRRAHPAGDQRRAPVPGPGHSLVATHLRQPRARRATAARRTGGARGHAGGAAQLPHRLPGGRAVPDPEGRRGNGAHDGVRSRGVLRWVLRLDDEQHQGPPLQRQLRDRDRRGARRRQLRPRRRDHHRDAHRWRLPAADQDGDGDGRQGDLLRRDDPALRVRRLRHPGQSPG